VEGEGESGDGLGKEGSIGILMGAMLTARRAVGEREEVIRSVSISIAAIEMRVGDWGKKGDISENDRGRLSRLDLGSSAIRCCSLPGIRGAPEVNDSGTRENEGGRFRSRANSAAWGGGPVKKRCQSSAAFG
jgi:hypothetical protein